jgi:NhaA family Na+:H+ antiporter
MSLLRSERFPALILLTAAAAGLVLANSPWADAALGLKHVELGLPGVFELSLDHWIADGLLAFFFFTASVELQFELTSGQLNSARRGVRPAIAAAGGVLVPVLIYCLIAGGTASSAGWPIPTATDIAFALGVLAVFGRGLPPAVRVFLLALAILDDIVGILFIALLFTDDLDVVALAVAAVLLAVFGVLSRVLGERNRVVVGTLLVVLAIAVWVLVLLSGVHATIAGVGLGLVMRQRPALQARHVLEPWVNAVVLPLFALSAALVAIPSVGWDELQPAFWGIALALPLGKLLGIGGAGWLAQRLLRVPAEQRLAVGDLAAAGALGGIGFTVSLLLSELAFAGEPVLRDEAILGVLTGSGISLVLAAGIVSWRAHHHRRVLREETA